MSPRDPYQEQVMNHYRNPRNYGELKEADAISKMENLSCGDEVTFYLKLDGQRVSRAQFTSRSCAICKASASMLTELATGKELGEVAKLGRDDVLRFFGGSIDPSRESCALLPLVTLKSALSKAGNSACDR